MAAVLAASLLLVGLLSALPMVSSTTPAPSAGPTDGPATLVTVTPSPQAGAAESVLAGGDIGTTVAFTATSGAGTLTITGASWTDTGEVPPAPGTRYLLVEVSLSCTEGRLAVDPILLAARTAHGSVLPGFGPRLDHPLGGRLLTAGHQVAGQVGYALAPGAVEVHLLDEGLRSLADVHLPAP